MYRGFYLPWILFSKPGFYSMVFITVDSIFQAWVSFHGFYFYRGFYFPSMGFISWFLFTVDSIFKLGFYLPWYLFRTWVLFLFILCLGFYSRTCALLYCNCLEQFTTFHFHSIRVSSEVFSTMTQLAS